MITISKLNESFLKVESETDIAKELSDIFSFQVDGAKFSPAYRMGNWDGYIRLFNLGKRTLPLGLFNNLVEFCTQREYEYELSKTEYGLPTDTSEVTLESVSEYMNSLVFSDKIKIRDYQIKGVYNWLKYYRGIALASVGAGKSLIIGVFCKYQTEVLKNRVLIVVPTVSLTRQLKSDFEDYFSHTGWSGDDNVHMITAGIDKNINKPIVVSTFQSIYKLPSEWFNQFNCIIGDEGHKITAETIGNIFSKATEVKYKLACTGTVSDTKCNILQMIGLTGPVYEIAPTAELIKNGQLVPLKIKAISLNYDKSICKEMRAADYETEIKFIASNDKRNNFISKLAVNCKGTTLVLFRYVDIQGIPLFNKIKEKTDRIVYFIDGSVKGADRELMRLSANTDSDVIIVASFPVLSLGVNIPSIESIVFAHPNKSKITSLQSIGRGLRLKEGKHFCTLYDIYDNMVIGKHVNHTMKHFGERVKIYTVAGFEFKTINVPF